MKLPNILRMKPSKEEMQAGEKTQVKICDFGISMVMNSECGKKALMKVRSGTAGYIAPEIKGNNKLVGPEIDMWAFGLILYEMCVAYKPTQVKNYRYGTGPIPFRPRDWKRLDKQGETVQDLILKCLQMDPDERITAEEALQHKWFNA